MQPVDQSPTEASATSEAAGAALPGWLGSSWQGARTGFRLVSYVAAPLAAVPLLLGLAITAFGLGSVRGWGIHPVLPGAVAFYALLASFGAAFGAACGLIGVARRRAMPGNRPAGLWAIMNRPMRLPLRLPRLPFRRNRRIEPGPPALTRPRPRRWPWLVGGLVLVLLTAAGGVGAYLGRLVDRRLAAAISDADRDDPAWRLDDLMAARDPVPDEENAALVVAEALDRLPENWPAGPASVPGLPKPPPSEAEEAYERLGGTPENIRLDDAVADALRDELSAYDEAVQLARSVAEFRRGRHELEIAPAIIDTLLGETQTTRTAARLLAADAAIRAHDGDSDGALDSCRAILATGRSIGDEPFLISQLVRLAIGGVAQHAARRVLGQGRPADEALARLQALVLDERSQPLLLIGLRGERAMMTELIRRVGAGEVPIDALSGGMPKYDPDARWPAIAPWVRLMFDSHRAYALGWFNDAVAIAHRPAHEQPKLWAAWDAEIVRVKETWHGKYSATLALLLAPAVSASGAAHARYQAELGATALLLAAERHRLRSGAWPASLDTIDRAILPEPLTDPFTGGPYRLERRDGQILLYSVGPDGKDDHGAFDTKVWKRGGPYDAGGRLWDVRLRGQGAMPAEVRTP